jgi:hypothetical protein
MIYQGYLDISYFSISTKALKDRGLKFALVYQRQKGCFEMWLQSETEKQLIVIN